MLTRHVLAAFAALLPLTSAAAAVTEADLRRHIEVLASDDFEGRRPGTPGEAKTLVYIEAQLRQAGLEPGAADGSWQQPVALVGRSAVRAKATFRSGSRQVRLRSEDIALLGQGERERIRRAPIWFAGYGTGVSDVYKGAVVLILRDAPDDQPDYRTRAKAIAAAGAAAVIGIDDEIEGTAKAYAEGVERLAGDQLAPVQGALTTAAARRLLTAARLDAAAVLARAEPVPVPVTASLETRTRVARFASANLIGRIAGSQPGSGTLLLLGHWDHLGICAPREADRICNGAVDNASGIATLIEAAKALAAGPRPQRDILFLATTAEEMGLLGAEAFALAPAVPLTSVVAAINVDTAAVAPRGEPVAIIGRGTTGIDPLADAAARELGRQVDTDLDANVMIQRQDGWALAQRGVPTVMVGGSFSDMDKLKAFLAGTYHKPGDDLASPLELGGAAEDADLLIVLARKLADPALYPPPAR